MNRKENLKNSTDLRKKIANRINHGEKPRRRRRHKGDSSQEPGGLCRVLPFSGTAELRTEKLRPTPRRDTKPSHRKESCPDARGKTAKKGACRFSRSMVSMGRSVLHGKKLGIRENEAQKNSGKKSTNGGVGWGKKESVLNISKIIQRVEGRGNLEESISQ